MNKTVFDLWLKALRSGNYVQCKGDYALLDEKSQEPMFCALGVLGDVADRNGFQDIDLFYDDDILNRLYSILDCDPYEIDFSDVIGWNDHESFSFEEIANRLEGKYGYADSSDS